MENGNKNCISFKYDDCQTYASGVGVWLTVTKTAICGLKAKVHSCLIKKIFNSSLKAALYMTNGKMLSLFRVIMRGENLVSIQQRNFNHNLS